MSGSAVVVGRSPLGRGIFAARAFHPGESILMLGGPVLEAAEVLSLGPDGVYALQIGPREFLDLMPPGRYLNHSCDPNAGLMADRAIIALRAIEPGEEIRFDYSTAMSEDHWAMECRCGEPLCRRVVLDFHHLPPITQNRYLQLGVVQRFIVDEVRRRSPARPAARRRYGERRAIA
ncbi:MAG TPA: SET domain-containing protein-lysine N-methyltransferase [Gemmatimonadales bacterium]|nr:SET domain-containing protein-lysine N-methyltransferase [Gemmatimonadales bacterium]